MKFGLESSEISRAAGFSEGWKVKDLLAKTETSKHQHPSSREAPNFKTTNQPAGLKGWWLWFP